jgi:hypothetical protein
MANTERLYDTKEAAFATRLTINSFRVKAFKLGIKGQRQGVKVYFTRAQLQDVYDNKPSRKMRALPVEKAKVKKATTRRAERKVRGKQ